ncbi:tyrosine-type recombinase/integrase [Cupriavidus necator]|uniref:tyrosine-type recombinase/integrase n=1 Tax=Cupriavidus necator TaxID=106590 RepID=UPI00339DA184
MTSLATHVSVFLRERLPLETRASERTCDTYALGLRLLFEYIAQNLNVRPSALRLEQIDAPRVQAFLEYLETQRHNKPATRNVRLAAIHSFMRFIEYREPSALEQVQRIRAIPMKRTDTRLVQYLTREEMQAVLDAPALSTCDGIRDRAMLYVAYSAGLRASELVGLRLENVCFSPQLSIHVLGKGRRERALPLWQETATALRAWLAIRPTGKAPEVFLNARGEAMTRSGFEYILEKHVRAAAKHCPSLLTKRISPHCLRHSCALLILQSTGDIRKVALWLGHASTQTTEMYLRADTTTLLEVMNATPPPSLRKGHFRPPDQLIALLRAGG